MSLDDIWQIAGAGDQQFQRLAHSSRRDTLELGAEDNNGQVYRSVTDRIHLLSMILPVPSFDFSY